MQNQNEIEGKIKIKSKGKSFVISVVNEDKAKLGNGPAVGHSSFLFFVRGFGISGDLSPESVINGACIWYQSNIKSVLIK